MFAGVYAHMSAVPSKAIRGHHIPGTGVTGGFELLYRCWDLNTGPLQGQPILLATEPSPQVLDSNLPELLHFFHAICHGASLRNETDVCRLVTGALSWLLLHPQLQPICSFCVPCFWLSHPQLWFLIPTSISGALCVVLLITRPSCQLPWGVWKSSCLRRNLMHWHPPCHLRYMWTDMADGNRGAPQLWTSQRTGFPVYLHTLEGSTPHPCLRIRQLFPLPTSLHCWGQGIYLGKREGVQVCSQGWDDAIFPKSDSGVATRDLWLSLQCHTHYIFITATQGDISRHGLGTLEEVAFISQSWVEDLTDIVIID